MTKAEADEKLEIIERIASEVEHDEELQKIDKRYSIMAKWIETDIECVDTDD